MMNLASPVLWVALAFAAQGVMAGSMMCGGTVIQDGQPQPVTAEQVLAACGEPTTRDFGQWVYAKPGELDKTLRFDDDGNLQSISVQFDGD
jgi:hypothetical protein